MAQDRCGFDASPLGRQIGQEPYDAIRHIHQSRHAHAQSRWTLAELGGQLLDQIGNTIQDGLRPLVGQDGPVGSWRGGHLGPGGGMAGVVEQVHYLACEAALARVAGRALPVVRGRLVAVAAPAVLYNQSLAHGYPQNIPMFMPISSAL